MKEKNRTGSVVAVFFCLVIIFSFVMGSVFRVSSFVRPDDSSGTVKYDAVFEKTDSGYIYRFMLPDRNLNGEYIAVQTTHFFSTLEIDGQNVYETMPAGKSLNKSSGIGWQFIKLRPDDSGKECTLTLKTDYKSIKPKAKIFFGEKYDIMCSEFAEAGTHVVLALLILVVGIMLLLYTLAIADTAANYASLYFSCYCILLASWSAAGSPVTAMTLNCPVLLSVIEHYSLMLMPVAFQMFLKNIYRNSEHKLWNIFLNIGVLEVAVRTFLQITGFSDLRETLWITQVYIVFFVASTLILSADEIIKNRMTVQHALNYICLALVLSATVAELVIFRTFSKQSNIGMCCFLLYVIIMAVNIVNQSQKTNKRAREAEIYKNLAYTDVLTGVFNRTAFIHDTAGIIEKMKEQKKRSPVVFMFDLNNLKKCNDEFGHENGDKYIKSVSAVISDVIGIDGRCYRIGGDEFCAVMPFSSQHEIENILNSISRRVKELNRAKFVVTMSVASGYAVYDPQTDASFDDTVKHADEMMYENKQKMKKEMSE